jgi:hypothetical protein
MLRGRPPEVFAHEVCEFVHETESARTPARASAPAVRSPELRLDFAGRSAQAAGRRGVGGKEGLDGEL